MDEVLPKVILDSFQVLLSIVGSIVVIAIVSPIFLLPVACVSVFFVFVRLAYLKTSKSIKRLEGNGTKQSSKILFISRYDYFLHRIHLNSFQLNHPFSPTWQPR